MALNIPGLTSHFLFLPPPHPLCMSPEQVEIFSSYLDYFSFATQICRDALYLDKSTLGRIIPSLTVVSLYGPALSFCKSGRIFFALLKETTFWGGNSQCEKCPYFQSLDTWKIIKMARRITINPRRLVHSLGDARPLPRPMLKMK